MVVRRCALVCAGMRGYAWVCVGKRECARVCPGVCGCGRVCMGICWYAIMRGCTQVCAQVCAGVCVDIHGCTHVCGMNFQNFFWRIESADFNTYPIRIFTHNFLKY